MLTITTPDDVTVELNDIKLFMVKDIFKTKTIIGKIQKLNFPVYLWKGEEEYKQAGVWTDESALERAKYVLSLNPIPWVLR